MNRKLKTTLLLILIVVYAILKDVVSQHYSVVVEDAFDFLSIDSNQVINFLNSYYRSKDLYSPTTLGKILYHPSYIALHIVFIQHLFSYNIKLRKIITNSFIGIILLVVLFGILFKFIGLHTVSHILLSFYKKLFTAPVILLLIEGGRILYNDILSLEKK